MALAIMCTALLLLLLFTRLPYRLPHRSDYMNNILHTCSLNRFESKSPVVLMLMQLKQTKNKRVVNLSDIRDNDDRNAGRIDNASMGRKRHNHLYHVATNQE